MNAIRKKIVTDENARPIAVQIEYEDWLEIERALQPLMESPPPAQAAARRSGAEDEAPMAGSIVWQGDVIAPVGEAWDAEQ